MVQHNAFPVHRIRAAKWTEISGNNRIQGAGISYQCLGRDVSGNETPIVIKGDRLKFWHDASIAKGLYINDGTLRLYGYFDEGPGDLTVIDPVTNKKPEQAPY